MVYHTRKEGSLAEVSENGCMNVIHRAGVHPSTAAGHHQLSHVTSRCDMTANDQQQ
jgi:hypothetical protein